MPAPVGDYEYPLAWLLLLTWRWFRNYYRPGKHRPHGKHRRSRSPMPPKRPEHQGDDADGQHHHR